MFIFRIYKYTIFFGSGDLFHDKLNDYGSIITATGPLPNAITPQKVIIVPKAGVRWGTKSVASSVMPVLFISCPCKGFLQSLFFHTD